MTVIVRSLLVAVFGLLMPAAALASGVDNQASGAHAQTPPAQTAPALNTRAAELRVRLDRLLGEHAFLTIQTIRTGVAGGDDFAAAAEALEGNTRELEAIIGSVYGSNGARRFGELWRRHLGYIVDYTVALRKRDEAGERRALAGLDKYQVDFSRFLADANPYLPQRVVSRLLGEHVTQLRQLAAFADRDFEAAYHSARHVYAHMFTIGDGLSAAIARQFPRNFPGRNVARSRAVDLRVTLDRLLGEHMFLSVETMRAGVTKAPDFAAARGALNGNSADVQGAVSQVYGTAAGISFRRLWDLHVQSYLGYIEAVASGDSAGRQRSLDELAVFRAELTQFLAAANPNLTRDHVAHLLQQHTDHLIAQVDAFAAGDFARAYSVAREGHRHSLLISDALAIAIATQFPEAFPALPETAAETSPAQAPDPATPLAPLGVGLAALLLRLLGLPYRDRAVHAARPLPLTALGDRLPE